jgi:TatA/E family protein of Tat protein translocase
VFNLGPGEITVILLLALIFLGPKRLPELASGLGKIIRDIRKATSDVKNEIALDETFRKPFDELREAVTLHPDELKRRDQIRESLEAVRKQAEEAERASQAVAKGEPLASVPPPPIAPAPVVPPPIAPTITAPADEGEPPNMGVSDSVAAAFAAVEPPAPPAPRARQRAPTPPPPAPPPATLGPETISFSSNVPASSAEVHASSSDVEAAPPPPPPPRAPAAPPPGTVSAPPTRVGPPRVNPPVSSLYGDAANKTQSLSEEDLMAAAASGPPPPPGSARKSTPPPLPGLVKPPPPPPGAKKV